MFEIDDATEDVVQLPVKGVIHASERRGPVVTGRFGRQPDLTDDELDQVAAKAKECGVSVSEFLNCFLLMKRGGLR